MPQMTKCKACKAVISEAAVACPKCGNPMKSQQKPLGCGGAMAIIFLVIVVAIAYTTNTTNKSSTGNRTQSKPATPTKKDVTMGAEFATLANCLETINSKVGPLDVAKDTPDKVNGLTRERKLFSCEKKVTGTKGTYFEGWYITTE